MDWEGCSKKGFVKAVKKDLPLASALVNAAAKKKAAGSLLPLNENTVGAKISLAYEALRELLEAYAILQGYKIYNHECFTTFLKERMHEESVAKEFDKKRMLRNDINYYGKEIAPAVAKIILREITELHERIKKMVGDVNV